MPTNENSRVVALRPKNTATIQCLKLRLDTIVEDATGRMQEQEK